MNTGGFGMVEVKLQNIRKCFGDKPILNISELCFPSGAITALVGKNGVGKSTLLGIIANLDNQYEGQVLFNSQSRRPDMDRRLVLVRQQAYLFRRSVRDNVAYPLVVRGIRGAERERQVRALLEGFGLEAIQNQKAHTLSGGEAQKVALARALAASPQLLLLDETTANIHPDALQLIERQLGNYHARTRCTIIFVTHDQTQAERLAHACVVLEAPQ